MDNFTSNLIKYKAATIALFSLIVFLLLICLLSFWAKDNPQPIRSKIPYSAPPDSMEIMVDLNYYLEFIDYSTDWNYTELSESEMKILKDNEIYYSPNGYWAKKVPKRGGF